jgi:RNA polymerase sigma-70 factor, ECF subfamily
MRDQDIVQRILAGEQKAMRELIIKYQDLVVNTCFQVLQNTADAEDMAQEVFIEAYRSMSSLRQEQQLSYWLYRIALNKSINLQKKNRFFRSILRIDSSSGEQQERTLPFTVAETGNDPFEALVHKEKISLIRQELQKLPARQQKAFILHHFEQVPYKDIAHILKVSLSTVESLLFRAKSTLRRKCKE